MDIKKIITNSFDNLIEVNSGAGSQMVPLTPDGIVMNQWVLAVDENGFYAAPYYAYDSEHFGKPACNRGEYLMARDGNDFGFYWNSDLPTTRLSCGKRVPTSIVKEIDGDNFVYDEKVKTEISWTDFESVGKEVLKTAEMALPLNYWDIDEWGIDNSKKFRKCKANEKTFGGKIYKSSQLVDGYPKKHYTYVEKYHAYVSKSSIGEVGDSDKTYWEYRGEIFKARAFFQYEGEYYLGDESFTCPVCGKRIPDGFGACHEIDRRIVRAWHSGVGKERFYGSSRFSLGFEVEKNSIEDGSHEGLKVSEAQPLWARIETDSSCGVELISNVYSTRGIGRQTFLKHLEESTYVNEPSDNRCGGHVGMSDSKELITLARIKPLAPVLYAAFHSRLKSTHLQSSQKIGGSDEHRTPLSQKPWGIECRLPNQVKDADTLKRRFDFFSVVIQLLRRDPCELTPDALYNATKKAYKELKDADQKQMIEYRYLIHGFHDVVVKGKKHTVLETGAFY